RVRRPAGSVVRCRSGSPRAGGAAMSGSPEMSFRGASAQDLRRPCVLFDSHHPKHYLTVRALARRCRHQGWDVVWTARRKDVLLDLMREDGLDPIVLTNAQPGLVRKLTELLAYDWKLLA